MVWDIARKFEQNNSAPKNISSNLPTVKLRQFLFQLASYAPKTYPVNSGFPKFFPQHQLFLKQPPQFPFWSTKKFLAFPGLMIHMAWSLIHMAWIGVIQSPLIFLLELAGFFEGMIFFGTIRKNHWKLINFGLVINFENQWISRVFSREKRDFKLITLVSGKPFAPQESNIDTLPETNMAPENWISQKESSLQGLS